MFPRLRHHLLTYVALCLLASCAAEESDGPSTGEAMEFSVRTDARSSRADAPAIREFAVFADMKFTQGETPVIIMDNVPVRYNQSTDHWEYTGTQYWFPQHEHSFVAVHPTSVAAQDGTQYTNSNLSLTYTLPSDHKATLDLIAATHRRQYELGAPATPVMLRFGHLMSQINIAAALDDNIMAPDAYLEFHKLEMSGFRTKATFNISPASLLTSTQTDDSRIEVNGHQGDGSLTIDFTTPVRIINDHKSVNILSPNEAIIMLPCAFAADSRAKIVLTYTISEDAATPRQLTLPLMNQSWDTGKSYTYRFTVDRKGSQFQETSIADWKVLDAGNINAH